MIDVKVIAPQFFMRIEVRIHAFVAMLVLLIANLS